MTEQEIVKLLSSIEMKVLSGVGDELWGKVLWLVEELQAENASLRARLEKAVELPCKIGDEVYEVHGKCDRKNCV